MGYSVRAIATLSRPTDPRSSEAKVVGILEWKSQADAWMRVAGERGMDNGGQATYSMCADAIGRYDHDGDEQAVAELARQIAEYIKRGWTVWWTVG